MTNARTSLAGTDPMTSTPTEDMSTIRSVLAETGMTADLSLEWLLDRFEMRGAGQ